MANLNALHIRSAGDTNTIRQQHHITNTVQSLIAQQVHQTAIQRARQYEINFSNNLATSLLGFQPQIGYRH